jgi:hypothetical protein
MLRERARWRAQHGATLGALDELLGSASLFGTEETQFLLRSCSIAGVLLFVLWALSPVGGQASLRLVSKNMSELWYQRVTSVGRIKGMEIWSCDLRAWVDNTGNSVVLEEQATQGIHPSLLEYSQYYS